MILDLFAGPGGWDVAARALELDPLGIEMDTAACLTRQAAGLTTWQGDVAGFLATDFDFAPVTGLIASPPCQTFSMAGKGAGRDALDQVLRGIQSVAMGHGIAYGEYEDIRTGLVLEPLRYALELEPEWMCWEQVPTVQPVWDACAEVLRADGYSCWTGHLHAEQYGVPQTRKRSVLLASRTRVMSRPEPTHSRFYPRSPGKLDMGVEKWVSMAEALGWDPATRVISNYGTGGDPRNRGERTADLPAATVMSKIDRNIVLRNNTSANAAERQLDEPAPTLYFGARMNGVYWQFAGAGATSEQTAGQVPRDLDMPAHTITGKGTACWKPTPAIEGDGPEDVAWVYDRPSPTIVGSFHPDVVAAPGYRTKVSRQNAKGSVRVTVQEAAVLQSFPADYPWQGSKTKQYQQVGNAIPPGLALHALAMATGLALPAAEEAAA